MAKSAAERKAAQRARQAAAGGRKLELVLDQQELDMVARNCAARRPGKEPYELNEYITMLIRQDDARLQEQIAEMQARSCGKCGDELPVDSCPCQGDSQCWTTAGWHELKLTV
ncbi:hypothetical protein CWR40_001169 [Cronobacter sakazakii]|uniref:hypothetical protein n=1 Tax=Cronobacter sakazakii TaxID=28141 RepID=UPI00029C33B5|nr:hypothetical protein [Cronobacter sakazakii]CCK12172.1 hypothetical protein BN126_2353 [Cronobacter sakazakii 680]AKE95957.1 hypothetical protein CSK29544_03006 [Cronobacter sakazakii]EGT4269347.1 hypothetical protein [Cronobacter sakazakii]EGT4283105.1 hypothetical protein [Cronobacter sakazakii]EGT4293248.1 hypothetical protein [Cronobacter sakazakii]